MARRIKVYISTGFAGCKHEDYEDLPDDWDEMTESEQEKELDQIAANFLANHIEYGAYVVDDGKGA